MECMLENFRLRAVIILILSAILLQSAEVRADSQKQMSLHEMTDLADEIVVGKVTESVARWQGKLIVTVSRIQVEESIKGQPGSTMEITQLGGIAVHPQLKAPVHMSASASAVLNPGEEVMLFVRKDKSGVRDLIGGPHGKLSVTVDPDTGDKIIHGGRKELVGSDENGRRTIRQREVTLNEMRREVMNHIQKGKKSGK